MTELIKAHGLNKNYGSTRALDNVSLSVNSGEIVGLIGPNGAGKSTLLKSLLGLTRAQGELNVLGRSPRSQRAQLLERLSYISDVASLPEWIKVSQLFDFMDGVHRNFDRPRARNYLDKTQITMKQKVSALSKGMRTQLHLALILGIDAELLILDEPTLGLDILFRTQFYETLINDFFSAENAILITTHQVEEIEDYLTRVVFINNGQIVLDMNKADIGEHYCRLVAGSDQHQHALALNPIFVSRRSRPVTAIGQQSTEDTAHGATPSPLLSPESMATDEHVYLYQSPPTNAIAQLGQLQTPRLAELFVAIVRHDQAEAVTTAEVAR